jgi:outer membrane protein OmpA-like peptidoglycan-associated protein
MRKIIQYGGVAGLALVLAGCDLSGIGGAAKGPTPGPSVTITEQAAPSALVVVLTGPAYGPALAGLVNTTARPREDLAVLQAGTTILGSAAPSPATVVVAGKPAAPGGGETSYQAAQYASRLTRWHDDVAAGQQAEAAQTRDAVSAWVRGLAVQAKAGRLADPPGPAGSLPAGCADASSALTGLEEANGNVYGERRVIVLYTDDLTGRPPVGSLTGDTVLVITPFTPTGAQASAAQADLLAAGAAQAAVAGPEVTQEQIDALVAAGLSQDGQHDTVSAPVLFANDSSALSGRTVGVLSALLPRLREAGVTAVINGFASMTGSAAANYTLSYQRAAAVATFFESRNVPASALIIVGHGVSDPVAPGSSGDNRRVTVVIEAP